MKIDKRLDFNKMNTRIIVLVIVFSFLTVVSLIMLFDRLGLFTGTNPSTVVSIASTSALSDSTNTSSSVRTVSTQETPDNVTLFKTRDDVTIWKTDTEIDIFKSDYSDPENSRLTVVGNGDKLLAPGTKYEYDFYVENNSSYTVDYFLTGDSFFSDESFPIPVMIKISDSNGVYVMGTETSWAPVLSLKELNTKRVLSPNSYDKFTLTWEWPYERGDDTYDTLLGDTATEKDLTLTVKLMTNAEMDTNPNAQGGEKINVNPKTGDEFPVIMWTILASVSLIAMFAIIFVYVFKRRINNNEEV